MIPLITMTPCVCVWQNIFIVLLTLLRLSCLLILFLIFVASFQFPWFFVPLLPELTDAIVCGLK